MPKSNLNVHLVFVPKYRRHVITERVFETILEALQKVCQKFKCTLEEVGYEKDHIHLLITYPPKITLSILVNELKGLSSRKVRAAHFSEVEEKLWGDHFWSTSYYASSCGGASLETVKKYVNQQKGRASSPP